jgi:hypothetical protein
MNDNRYWLLLPVAYSAVLLHWRSYTLTGAVRFARDLALRSKSKSIFFISVSGV